jgi:phage terminase large subunit-like protein
VAAYSDADIVIMGGSAGGGKTFWLTYEGAKYVDVPGYQAAFFRRTYPELTGSGSIWDEAEQLYPLLGGVRNLGKMTWQFPAERTLLEFRHLQHEASAEKHKSKQYARVLLDEVTDFTEKQFWKLWSRCRSKCGVRSGLRASCNPDPDSFIRTLIAWWIGEDGYAIPERSGVKRYFIRDKRDLVWADTAEELVARGYRDSIDDVTSITFVRSSVYDNKILLTADPKYLAKLKDLPPAERDRFLGGNWNVRENEGDLFQRSWFKPWGRTQIERRLLGQPALDTLRSAVSTWDFASTPVRGDLVPGNILRPEEFVARPEGTSGKEANWSANLRVWRTTDDRYVIDRIRRHRDTPGAVRQWMLATAHEDGAGVSQACWQDPGQAGVDQVEQIKRDFARAHIARRLHFVGAPAANKFAYARLPSRTAYAGRILLHPCLYDDQIAHRFLQAFFNEAEAFPEGECDDMVDCLSLAILYLEQFGGRVGAPLVAGGDFSAERAFMLRRGEARAVTRRLKARDKFGPL